MNKIRPILFVSSDISNRDNIASRLRYANFTTELCGSGFHTIHLLEESKLTREYFSLLLVLGKSEDMPADEIVSLSRNVFLKKELPILYLSVNDDLIHKQEVAELGAKVAPYSENFNDTLELINKMTAIKKN